MKLVCFFKISFASFLSSFHHLFTSTTILLCWIPKHPLFILVYIFAFFFFFNTELSSFFCHLWTCRRKLKSNAKNARVLTAYKKWYWDVTYWFGSKVTHSSCRRRLAKCTRNKLTPLCSSVTHRCPIPCMVSEPHVKTKYFLQPHRIVTVCSLLLVNDWSSAKSIILNNRDWRKEKKTMLAFWWGGNMRRWELHIPAKGDFYL